MVKAALNFFADNDEYFELAWWYVAHNNTFIRKVEQIEGLFTLLS
jgi:hypothetical protein